MKYNFTTSANSLIVISEDSSYNETFLKPTFSLSEETLTLNDFGIKKNSFSFNEIGTIGGVVPINLTDSISKLTVLIENFNSGGGSPQQLELLATKDWVIANFEPIQATLADDIVILYNGQSNAGGRVPIANASAGELLPQTNLKVWNQTLQLFQDLYIPTNNQSGFNQFGSEVVYAVELATKFPGKTIYLVKYHEGNTRITHWMNGGAGGELFKRAFAFPAIKKLIDEGKTLALNQFFHQGEADNSFTYGGLVHLGNIRTHIQQQRAIYGYNLPIVFGEIVSSTNEINTNFDTIASEFTNIAVASMEGATTIDGIHFDNTAIRSLGTQQIDLMPLPYGSKLTNQIPIIYHYLIRNIQYSEVESSLYNLIIDLEYCSIHAGNTLIYVDGVLKNTLTISNFGTTINTVTGLSADGLVHTVKIQNSINGTFVEQEFTAPSASVGKVVNIDFSTYTVPTTDDTKFERWKGEYAIDTIAGVKGIHLTSDTGGLYSDTARFVRLIDAPLTSQSFTAIFDGLFEINSTIEIEGYFSFKAFNAGTARIKGYRVRIRHNRIYLYECNGAGEVTLADSGAITSPTVNTWRKYKVEVIGYKTIVSYSNDNGVTWIEKINFTNTNPLTFGIPTTKLFYNAGSIMFGSIGSQPQKFWVKDINITL